MSILYHKNIPTSRCFPNLLLKSRVAIPEIFAEVTLLLRVWLPEPTRSIPVGRAE